MSKEVARKINNLVHAYRAGQAQALAAREAFYARISEYEGAPGVDRDWLADVQCGIGYADLIRKPPTLEEWDRLYPR